MVGSVPCLWPDSTIVCLGSGPSLTLADVERIRPAHVIAVNDAINFAPWAPVLYAADWKWWEWYPHWLTTEGLHRFTTSPAMRTGWPAVTSLYATPTGLSLRRTCLATGGSGGYAAVNLAVLLGARRIFLLGYDMMPGPQGEHHFFGEHRDGSHLAYAARLRPWPELVEAVHEQGVELVNLSRRTALPVPHRAFDDVFACAR